MEFDEDVYKIVGVIKKELGVGSARIKVLALLSKKNKLIRLSRDGIVHFFPPIGYVFEPGFFRKYKYKVNDIISFKVEKNDKALDGYDEYRLNSYDAELKEFGLKACMVNGFEKKGLATNLNSISLANEVEGTFYGITDKYIIGKLKITGNGKIEPFFRSRVHLWDLDPDNILCFEDNCRLINEPQEDFLILDCMDDKQLFEWFRNCLKQIRPEYVNMLDHKANWRIEIPRLFENVDEERLKADNIRWKRIEEKMDLLELSEETVLSLAGNSEKFKKIFSQSIKSHIEEFKDKYKLELDEFKNEIDQQKLVLSSNITDLEKQKISKDMLLKEITETVKLEKEKLDQLKENKDRIIQDFSIIKDVLQEHPQKIECNNLQSDSFVIEEIENNICDKITSVDQFEEQLKYQLFENKINPMFAKNIYNVTSLYNIILVKDIRMGIAIAKATNNAKYIIQQVEPDWLHFSDFWNNGLGKIWESAQNLPETFHFLLLEDINMSALECYCRPLLDIINGVRNKIPYGKTSFPPNLKILATIASFDEPAIGLPIYKDIFENCGAVGFRGNINGIVEPIIKPESKLLSIPFLEKQVFEEFEIEEIKNGVDQEINKIFEL